MTARRTADRDTEPGELVDTIVELEIGAVAHGGHCVARASDGLPSAVGYVSPLAPRAAAP